MNEASNITINCLNKEVMGDESLAISQIHERLKKRSLHTETPSKYQR